MPKLVRAALLHVQFETIHLYLDGNGRIGRLMIALLLQHWELLKAPLLYISLFFKRRREEYYRRLNLLRLEGIGRAGLTFSSTVSPQLLTKRSWRRASCPAL